MAMIQSQKHQQQSTLHRELAQMLVDVQGTSCPALASVDSDIVPMQMQCCPLSSAFWSSAMRTVSEVSFESSSSSSEGDSSSTSAGRGMKRSIRDLLATSSSPPISNNNSSNHKRQKLAAPLKRVRFHSTETTCTDQQVQVQIHEYPNPPEDCRKDLWWTREELSANMTRHESLLRFYYDNCEDLVDSALLLWVNCAEEAGVFVDSDDDTDKRCMTPAQRATVAYKVAHSPIRGFERELAGALIVEQRQKTLRGILELQILCRQVNDSEEVCDQNKLNQVLAEASQTYSATATLFARTLAIADAQVANADE